ncbi:carotenoid oxygenase family protein [Actinokineospora iranica]|uniref:Dioxygenase n=1 Tax=Actinokineospora iranica TaxID=1271860 RepID=A0A1G6IP15_9PSEU|nr:carotenoid oxygenase family protein [Actinokineospora iranica]SDC08183.1 carotenoid cleavage dioxygenase [Actinokineospora iranica]
MGNSYLEGNYRPVREESTLTGLSVTGAIPEHLDGRYLKIGPNPVAEVDPDTYNWFMGDGMVHGVRLRDGNAEWYRSRWVRTPALGGPKGAPGTLDTLGANTNVLAHAGRTLALIEAGVSGYELSDELDTLRACDFDGTLRGGYTAHPLRDPVSGELHAVSYFFGWGDKVRYTVIGADGRLRRQVDIEVGGSPMMHNFSLTEKHVVFYDLPVTFDPRLAVGPEVPAAVRPAARLVLSAVIGRVRVPDPIAAAMGTPLRPNGPLPYRWNPGYPARVGVMPRSGGSADVRWFEIEPCYVYHPFNAYDDGDRVVLDVVRHPKTFDTNIAGPAEGLPTVERWVVDLAAGAVSSSRVDDRPQEFPRVDERVVGRRHRFGYSVAFGADGLAGTLLKHDHGTGSAVAREFGRGRSIGEFVFHPNSADAAEDDGVLMGYVHDAAADRSDLVLLDAETLATVAAVHLPTRVPNGFHGNWAPTGNMA